MNLYLVQHGEATSKEEDPARPLTARGRREVMRVAQAANRAQVEVDAIYQSGKLRAEQTAEVFADNVQPASELLRMDGIGPTDDPGIARERIAELDRPTMLVGHLPHLSRLASLLVTGDADADLIAFRNGGVVCLARGDDGRWRIGWVLTPEIAV